MQVLFGASLFSKSGNIFLAEKGKMSDYKKDETMVIYLYNTQDLRAVISGKRFPPMHLRRNSKKESQNQ